MLARTETVPKEVTNGMATLGRLNPNKSATHHLLSVPRSSSLWLQPKAKAVALQWTAGLGRDKIMWHFYECICML